MSYQRSAVRVAPAGIWNVLVAVLLRLSPRPDQYEYVPVFGGVMTLLRALSGRSVISAWACFVDASQDGGDGFEAS